ncbi:hypothetical protein TNIN_343881 [Trichonephila inaurata madagascariensis]|uniref:Major facilitator superfamily (MFS) profile domain-containing protein n=1 Tax=Trichonephila inaurata madagascariensis TaxID=2747483 RepID=A0A8X7C7P1_9ARAC|nr:hypothetical protein TNIN_343881 [Trichonephila inaurata madagascariensis]
MYLTEIKIIQNIRTWYFPKRFVFTLLGFLGILISYCTRVNLSIAMVAMVNTTDGLPENVTKFEFTSLNSTTESPATSSHLSECPKLLMYQKEIIAKDYKGKKFNWDTKTRGFILSSFYYGYVVTQMPGGILCDRVGAKFLFGSGILMTCLLYLFIPLAASQGAIFIIAIRVLQGFSEGLTFPAITYAISNWSPKCERSRISAIIGLGMPLGNILAMPLSGFMSSVDTFGGWPSTFYLFGSVGIIWFVFWNMFVYETPDNHPHISPKEFAYIQKHKNSNLQKKENIPWKDILTSFPMWAVVVAHFGHNYAYLMFLTDLPTYFSTILHFDLGLNGTMSALPYVVQATSALIASCIADKLRASNVLRVTTIRKMCNSIGLFGPALCLLAIIASGCRPVQIVSLFCVALFLNGFAYSGYRVTHVDMTPDFAGIIFGITNTVSNISGIISPMVVGILTFEGETMANWSKVFYITSAVYIICALFYAVFASAEVQPWGEEKKENDKEPKPDRIYFVETTVN